MYLLITIERPEGDLRKQVWKFSLLDSNLVLDGYSILTRKTTRHRNWEVERIYSRTQSTRSYYPPVIMAESDVPWPEDVRAEALTKLVEQIKVVRWKTDLNRKS